ncbi:hypothetical protein ISU10_12900, partial [Nocardioides agariphilus]|nr:hypothetical protein [Nocardioides agariphilus]
GKVGRHLVRHLTDDGARVVVTDVNAGALLRASEEPRGCHDRRLRRLR